MKKTIAIFGSTGSIGKNTVEVIKNDPEKFDVKILVAGNDVKTLIEQALLLKPKYVAIANANHFKELQAGLCALSGCNILAGHDAILDIARYRCDLFISAIVGAAGMLPTLAAIEAGSNVALANKESLVCAGKFLLEAAKKSGAKLFPIDSEHNAIFQIFENENLHQIEAITLTASGGPFFNKDVDFNKIGPKQALKHPNWEMGAKVSIDSATMMNKGLEVIEAYHLFDIKKEQIKIIVHPQSIVHGMVDYKDGSTLAMLSAPDMKVPISYALSYPHRMPIKHDRMDLATLQHLTFFAPDEEKFPAIRVCRQALQTDGSAPVVLNAANEIAVARFLKEEISFVRIATLVEDVLNKISHQELNSIEQVLDFDQKSRILAQSIS